MPSTKNAVFLVVISFLVIALVFSSTAPVLAKPPKPGPITCKPRLTLAGNAPKTECCQDRPSGYGTVMSTWCTTCDNTSPPSNCSSAYCIANCLASNQGNVQPPSTPPRASNETGVNNPPGNLGTVQSPSTPPPSLNAIPPPSALPSPTKQQKLTTTCPNGLRADADGNCPPTPNTNTNQQSGLTSNNNNPTSGHHKGSNQPTQTGGGGQELTATKKHKGSKTDQGTTQP